MRFIFDLDGTVIDSTHRQGDTLDDWRRLNTARNVALDSPLPLLDQMRDAIADDLDVIVCTSRVMSGRDFRCSMTTASEGSTFYVALPQIIALAGFSSCTCSKITPILSGTLGRDSVKLASCLMMTRASKIP